VFRRGHESYLQTKTSETPSCLAIPFAVCTAVRKDSSLTVFDCWRATVIVRPRGLSGLPVFLPVLDQHILLIDRYLGW